MSSNTTINIERSAGEVFKVLCDPTTYPGWLVGAKRVVDVDDAWPAIGSSFRHRLGWGPLQIPGSTTVRRLVPNQILGLSAGMGVLGEADVTFRLEEHGDVTTVLVEEAPSEGVVGVAERFAKPVVAVALWGRNRTSLAMLRELVLRVPAARSEVDRSTDTHDR